MFYRFALWYDMDRTKGGNEMKPILEIESLKKYYGKAKSQTKALDGITFQVMPGEFLGIMGSSGSGGHVKIRLS